MVKRTKEDATVAAWERAFKHGSKSLQARLRSIHAKNPAFQQFLKDNGLDVVKVRDKTAKAKAKASERKAQSNKAWGATKGTKMGGEDGSSQELRDTTVPLSPEQHAKVKAAEKAAKPVQEKKAKAKKAPAKKKAPEAAPSRLDLLKKFASRKMINNPPVSAKQLRTIAAVGGQDHDHGGWDDLSDTEYGGRNSYNEEVEQFKVGDKVSIHAPDDLDWHEREGELVSTSDDGHVVKLSGGQKLSVSKHQIKKINEEVEQVDEMIPYALSAANYQAELTRAKREKLAQLRAQMKKQLDKDSEDTSNPFASYNAQQRDMKKEEVEQIAERKWNFAARIKRRLIPGVAIQQATRRAADLGDQAETHANLGRGIGSTTSPKDAKLARIKAKAAGKYRKIAAVDEAVKKSAAPARRMGSVARYSAANKNWQFVRDPMVKTITGMSEGMLSNIVARLTKKKPVDLKAAAKQRRADAIKYAGKSPKPKQSYQGLPSDMTRKPSHTRSERDANVVLGAKK